jgi:hypothetical protein
MRIVIAGGGAAGFFAAISCAERNPAAEVVLFEKSPEVLAKVAISGGGRCNVTHACFDPVELAGRYPRGGRELIGPFHRWQPRDTMRWFEARGIALKTEPDGRVFPASDDATTITTCLRRAAEEAGVRVMTRCGLATAVRKDRFELALTSRETPVCDRLLIATGGNRNSRGFQIAASLGHAIEPPAPSLFTFHVEDPRIGGLQGISVPDAEISVLPWKLRQRGPVLITHWGLSGPAILRLSAWGARRMSECDYQFDVTINWRPGAAAADLASIRSAHARKAVGSWSPWKEIPVRLWASLVRAAGIPDETTWGSVSRAALASLSGQLFASVLSVRGKSLFKDEFVTCGGVSLREVDFRTMESRVCKGLFFAGEVLDIDGVTGGFNLQAAWTTGWIAGMSLCRDRCIDAA